jgi:two-component system, LytTR family, sensor kinase
MHSFKLHNMKKTLLFFCILIILQDASGQVNWIDTGRKVSDLDWNNYSTSYIGDDTKREPVLVTAIPYDGIYNMQDRSALDMDFSGSAFRFRSNLGDHYRKLFTYSKNDVYFLVPGIFRSNAKDYEFRVLINDNIVLMPWSDIKFFVDDDFSLNEFPKKFAFLGGFHADWDQYLVAELRKKGSDTLTAASVVYWKQAAPQLVNIFTSAELNDLLLKSRRPFDFIGLSATSEKWKGRYSPDEIDSVTLLPKELRLHSDENNLTFVLGADIYKKEALIYSVVKNGKVYRKPGINDNANNLISLRDLAPGKYSLLMHYASQPQKISAYSFEISEAWYQKLIVKVIGVILLAGFALSFFLWWKLSRQQRKMEMEQTKRELLQLGLKTIQSQLNPHFMFNALSSIQGLINSNNIEAANRYLSDFGILIRSALTDNNKEFIPLQKEVNTLETYLKLEQLRFNFAYEMILDQRINTAATELPSLLLQPLVENAVKHGISGMNEKGRIEVSFTRQEDDLLVVVRDNGTGFDVSQQAAGFGLKLTKDRINLLNEIMPDRKIHLAIKSNINHDTTIELLFKNWLV